MQIKSITSRGFETANLNKEQEQVGDAFQELMKLFQDCELFDTKSESEEETIAISNLPMINSELQMDEVKEKESQANEKVKEQDCQLFDEKEDKEETAPIFSIPMIYPELLLTEVKEQEPIDLEEDSIQDCTMSDDKIDEDKLSIVSQPTFHPFLMLNPILENKPEGLVKDPLSLLPDFGQDGSVEPLDLHTSEKLSEVLSNKEQVNEQFNEEPFMFENPKPKVGNQDDSPEIKTALLTRESKRLPDGSQVDFKFKDLALKNKQESLNLKEEIPIVKPMPTVELASLQEPIISVGSQEGTYKEVASSKWTNQLEIVETIKHRLRVLKEEETTTLTLKLYPRHLGAMSVQLNLTNGIIQADIWLDNPEVQPLIEDALAGVDMDQTTFQGLNVNINQQRQQQPEQPKAKGLNKSFNKNSPNLEEMEVNVTSKPTGILNLTV